MDLMLKGKVAIVGDAKPGPRARVRAGACGCRHLQPVSASRLRTHVPRRALKARAAETALDRIGEPKELANRVAFLASARGFDGGLVRSVM